jgi:hypothetical protein
MYVDTTLLSLNKIRNLHLYLCAASYALTIEDHKKCHKNLQREFFV